MQWFCWTHKSLTMAVGNQVFSAPSHTPLGKGWSLMEALLVLNDSLIQMHYLFPYLIIWKFTSRLTDLTVIRYLFPLSYFVIEGFRLRAQGQFAYILCCDQFFCPSRVAALQSVLDPAKLVWITQECSTLKKKRDCEAAASLNPCSQLSSYEVILGLKIYTTGILSCILERSQIGQEYSREMLYPGVEVPWDLILLPLHGVQMHTNRKNYTALSAAFLPGEVIILWVDCVALSSGRPFLPMGLTNHFSFRQWVSVSLYRDNRPTLF